MKTLKSVLILSLLLGAAMVQSCASALSQGQEAPPPPEEPAPIEYKNPLVAMMDGYNEAAEIEINPAWKLTEKQKSTALLPPRKVQGATRCYYVYPEDSAPTAAQLADGSALNANQRRLMKKARLYARRLAAWHSRMDAEKYNREHSAELAESEKKGIHLVINLRKQRGVCKDGDKVLRNFRVCSGKRSTPTPKGHFHIMEKHAKHNSNVYNNAPMPYFMRLTINGVGLHQGNVRAVPSSHGCIRLTGDDARFLFRQCRVGTAVFIEN